MFKFQHCNFKQGRFCTDVFFRHGFTIPYTYFYVYMHKDPDPHFRKNLINITACNSFECHLEPGIGADILGLTCCSVYHK